MESFLHIYLQNRWNSNCLIRVFDLNAAVQEAVEQINWRLSETQFSYRGEKVEREKWEPRSHFH